MNEIEVKLSYFKMGHLNKKIMLFFQTFFFQEDEIIFK